MDILLANAPVKKPSRHAKLEPPLGLAYIAAVLRDKGYNVSVIDFNITEFDPGLLEGILKRETPRILGISAHTETYLNGVMIANFAKQVNPDIKVVMGGTHPTILYGEVTREKSVDVVVRGEGEYAMLELADCIMGRREGVDLSQIKGIAYRENGVLKATPGRPFVDDPDELPFPARDLFPLPFYKSPGNVLMSRGGCPFSCRFCAVNNIWGGKRRFRRPEKVVEEIVSILASGQANEIAFADDVFTLDRRRALELLSHLRAVEGPMPLRWTCASRVDLVDRELLEEMHKAGCYAIQFGVESGSQEILDCMAKGITIEQVRGAVRAALDVGMKVLCAFMFPQPLDTEETIREQGRFMKELLAMGVEETLGFTTPLPGTFYYNNASMAAMHPALADDPDADKLGITILASNWDEYDAKHLLMTGKYLSKERLESLFEELVRDVGLTNRDAQPNSWE